MQEEADGYVQLGMQTCMTTLRGFLHSACCGCVYSIIYGHSIGMATKGGLMSQTGKHSLKAPKGYIEESDLDFRTTWGEQ